MLSASGSSKPKAVSSLAMFWGEVLLGLGRVSVAVLMTPRLVAATLGGFTCVPSSCIVLSRSTSFRLFLK